MPEYLSPGVYIEEMSSGPRPIEGISTTTAAFIGFAPSGPANTPIFIANWSQYLETFGSREADGTVNPHMPGTYMSHSVYGYFNNGGTRCYITRIVPPNRNKDSGKTVDMPKTLQLSSRASKALPALTVGVKGQPASDVNVEVQPAVLTEQDPTPADGVFTLRVRLDDKEETFENVSMAKKHPRNVVEVVNQHSQIIEILEQSTAGALAERVPEFGGFTIHSAFAPTDTSIVLQSNHFVGSVHDRSGIEGMEVAEDVSMLCAPDLMSAYQNGLIDEDGVKAVQRAMIDHCERNRNRVALIDPLPDLNPQQVKRWREHESNFDSSYAALYYPWIKINGPEGRPILVPPSGHMAGIYARSDVERGVHKAPANEIVRGALDPAMQITKSEQDILNPIGVNCIRTFPGMGLRIWGARTLSSDARFRYVSVRRIFNFVEKSIERGTQWAVFEPNDDDLWSKLRRDITAFLTIVWRSGALFGKTPGEAFYVKCDAELNPPEVRDLGMVMVEIGIAPVKPAEFVVLRFGQYAGTGQ
ncbi:phage tail sheath subtilisin-like domain-containing protein [Deinococcus sp. Leaf326]|uniref:phage tail sheath family protein n=1 Tax=Deinococcus sp. Leaf326 TaxID=1736338 RepID=UPI0006F9708C|nr:phage tail sheath subtilisin-like domain-containing protein [Deinococcus sp. Leaf326]KQR00987.1 phage tail protein [Deinococcus sp. Leaf326]